ncbi:hypothetical protein BKA70DRAFT_1287915 [Coprinopsis sp. MPI-PUGE-AT-0042]|nr:hypothetical protein BKA70DRAFT_1287915 [Coprinopsis sp. MPI-PUGE-AT-0042]
MTSTVEHPPPEPSQPSQPPSTAPSQPSAEPSEPPPGIPLTPMATPSPSSAEPLSQPITPTSSLEGNLDDPIQVPSIPIDGGESLSPVVTALDTPTPSERIVTSKVTVAVLPHTTLVGAVTLAEARVASETLSDPKFATNTGNSSFVGSASVHPRSDTSFLLLWVVSFSVALVPFRV